MSLSLIPRRPASREAARTRYGLQVGSGLRRIILAPSPRSAGTRIIVLRLLSDQDTKTGHKSLGRSRLYEFTSWLATAVMARACRRTPPM